MQFFEKREEEKVRHQIKTRVLDRNPSNWITISIGAVCGVFGGIFWYVLTSNKGDVYLFFILLPIYFTVLTIANRLFKNLNSEIAPLLETFLGFGAKVGGMATIITFIISFSVMQAHDAAKFSIMVGIFVLFSLPHLFLSLLISLIFGFIIQKKGVIDKIK